MSRTGVEPKPPWRAVPVAVRHAVEAMLGSQVRRGARVWGGYGPSPTYRLRLADGRGAFFKAVNPASNEFMHSAHAREERAYSELDQLIGPWAPTFYGAIHCAGWDVMLLEDLGPKSAPPWMPGLARRGAQALADFHTSTLGASLPDWLPQPGSLLTPMAALWGRGMETESLRGVVDMAGDQHDAAGRWLEAALPTLAQASRRLPDVAPPHALLHFDVRSDNLRWVHGRLRLVDWPHVASGPPELDAAAFAQSVTVEGGPAAEQVMAWYGERSPLRGDALDASVAWLAAFFAYHAWRPDIEGLPRLRPFQRQQLAVCLAWAARRLDLPPPLWLTGVVGRESLLAAGVAEPGPS